MLDHVGPRLSELKNDRQEAWMEITRLQAVIGQLTNALHHVATQSDLPEVTGLKLKWMP